MASVAAVSQRTIMSLIPFSSQLIADVGISMGDEGKGRLIPEIVRELKQTSGLASPVSVVLKVNGGANSGHTAGGIKLNLLPAGVVEPDITHLCIGSGVVADPRKVFWEGFPLERKGYAIFSRLVIDERTMVSDLTHRLLDLAWENYRTNILKEESRGSTGRGISPAFSEETSHWQYWYADFLGPREKFARMFAYRIDRTLRTIQHVCRASEADWDGFFTTLTNAELRANAEAIAIGVFPKEEFDFARFKGPGPFSLNVDLLVETYWDAGQRLTKIIRDVREIILRELVAGRTVIGEFGQAYWLDKRFGFPPNVTASHTVTPEFFLSAGIPNQAIHTFGVAKAYDTKVGTHVFLTQMEDNHSLAVLLKQLEFGATTGRQRMVGWFDAVEKGDALRYGGFQDLMINKIDALTHRGDWQGELLICEAYRDANGKMYHHVPRNDAVRRTVQPVYRGYAGWSEDISGVRSFAELPKNARTYVSGMVRSIIAAAYDGEPLPAKLPNLRYLGVGPEPSQIIKDLPPTAELMKLSVP
jgi:adenylosuccinate synthase